MTRAFILYMIESPSGKRYVGITSLSLRTRWIQHCSEARRGSADLIHRAIRKYGADSMILTEIARGEDWAHLCQLERQETRAKIANANRRRARPLHSSQQELFLS